MRLLAPLLLAFFASPTFVAGTAHSARVAPRTEPPACTQITELMVFFGKQSKPAPGATTSVEARALLSTPIDVTESARLLKSTVKVRDKEMTLSTFLNNGHHQAEADRRRREGFRGKKFRRDKRFFMKRPHHRSAYLKCTDGLFMEVASGPISTLFDVVALKEAGARVVPIPNPG